MATVINRSGGRVSTVNKPKPVSRKSTKTPIPTIDTDVDLTIPDEPCEPEYDLSTCTFVLHGEEGIGKTSVAREFPSPLFLMFEPGGKFLSMSRIPRNGQFSKWSQFVKVIDNLLKSDTYRTVVIDTVDLCYILCEQHICEENVEQHINDGSLGFNRGNDKAEFEFKEQILRITGSGRGVIFISHSKSVEFEKSTGVKHTKIIPTMKDRVRRFLKGFVDMTMYFGYSGNKRILTIEGSDDVDAKNRMGSAGRFFTPKGEAIRSVDMGDSAQEGYDNFLKAFNNQQVDPGDDVRTARLSEVKAKFAVKKK